MAAGCFRLANGRDAMYKPPLFHWTALAIDRLLGIGKVTAFNLRLPAALYGVGGYLLIVCFTYTIFGGARGAARRDGPAWLLSVRQPGPLRARGYDADLLRGAWR